MVRHTKLGYNTDYASNEMFVNFTVSYITSYYFPLLTSLFQIALHDLILLDLA